MRRRAYLGTLAGVGLLAGCTGGEDGTGETATARSTTATETTPSGTVPATATETSTATETPEETSTETPTERPEPPYVTRANLVWTDRGDDVVRERRVESEAPGPGVQMGVEAVLPVENGTVSTWVVGGIFDSEESSVTGFRWQDEREATGPGPARLQSVQALDLTDVPTGRYSVSLVLADSANGDPTSEATAFSVEFVDPLDGDDVRLVASSPEEVRAGETFTPTLELRNSRGHTSSIVSPLELAGPESDRREEVLEAVQLTVPSDGPVTTGLFDLEAGRPGTYEFALPDVELSWTTTVTSPGT